MVHPVTNAVRCSARVDTVTGGLASVSVLPACLARRATSRVPARPGAQTVSISASALTISPQAAIIRSFYSLLYLGNDDYGQLRKYTTKDYKYKPFLHKLINC